MQVDLTTGAAQGGDAQGDVLLNIENLAGSALADTLVGNSGANILSGGDGNDLLTGAAARMRCRAATASTRRATAARPTG